ncbi:MAG: putative quinol monooxygenase [Candidatus Nanopelagicales bacterium]
MELRQSLTPGRRGMLVRLAAADGMRPALLDALHRYSDGLDEEPGTEVFIVHVDPDDANIVWLYEVFHDDDAQNDHRAAEGFAELMSELPDMLGSPPAILRLDPLRMSLQEQVLSEDLTF